MHRFAAALLFALARLAGRMPWRWHPWLAARIASSWLRTDARESRVALRNLELAFPDMPSDEREALRRRILVSTARQLLETLRFWTRPHSGNLALVHETEGESLFETAIASGRGVIVAAPHHGNWELLNQWLAARTPISILYAPPESRVGEDFLRRARAADDARRVTQVRAEASGVRQLLRTLREGGVVGILPDQQPKGGDGEFAPFFGYPALTMTLLSRLAARSGAIVVFAWCERLLATDLAAPPAFAVHVEPAPPDIASTAPGVGVRALDAAVERIARRDLAQYQWTYKRYTLRPSGRGEDNPYRDIERRRR
ncbi:lauroyl acyltransferase [Pseudoluteimonas lycopersici]|uniref:Lauroyl acyltransferase n=1 Tax=Pseudoluteimonas lycopersici TaxID=1324796 RepID=A0A516V6W2_9GAMM|nr:lauroyl acyltransferase [Lysobacter lycopersici]QDQ74257.1 lauroyl acyltransferase [Lysobacter lycopersici]